MILLKWLNKWCNEVTFNDLLKDYVDTLFVICLILAYLIMVNNSSECVLINSNYKGHNPDTNFTLSFDSLGKSNITSNLTFSIPDYSQDRVFFKSLSDRQKKGLKMAQNIYIYVIPNITFIYVIFYFIFIWSKRKVYKEPIIIKDEVI